MTAKKRVDAPKKPWEAMEPQISKQAIELTAATYRVDVDAMARWVDAYTNRFALGPEVFVPWYKQQRLRFEQGLLSFEPYYPHEVYPQLLGGASWLYDHPAWKQV